MESLYLDRGCEPVWVDLMAKAKNWSKKVDEVIGK